LKLRVHQVIIRFHFFESGSMRLSMMPVLALSAVALGACDDGITGPGPKASISLDFCENITPVWLAIQNEQRRGSRSRS
jgi:hypothetical protein